MAADIERLETALRNAHAAGDTAAAQQFAQQIRSLRAGGGGQQASSPMTVDPQPSADPLADVPTELGGQALDQDMREAILAARNIKDPKERRILTARIAGRLAAQEDAGGNIADEISRSGFGAALRGYGAGLFGAGDLAAAGGTFLRSQLGDNAMSFGEALEAQREFRRALEEDFPITSGLSELTGAITGGGGASLAARGALKAGTKGRTVLDAATRFQKGQKFRNILRAAGMGGVAGAVTEGITEGNPEGGAAVGAAAGPIGLGLVRAGQITAKAVKDALDGPAGKSMAALAKKLGETPEEISRRFLEFREATGKGPTIADIANSQAVAELRDMIAGRVGAEQIVEENVERSVRARAGEFADQVSGGRVTTTPGRQAQARKRVGDEQFGKVRDEEFTFSPDEAKDFLSDPDLRQIVRGNLRRRIDEALEQAGESGPVTLEGTDVLDLRQLLRQRSKKAVGADRIFLELRDELDDIAGTQSDNYTRALDESAMRARRQENVAAGMRVNSAPTSTFTEAARQTTDAPEKAALMVGARSGLRETALESASSASGLANRLAQDGGLVRRLRAVMRDEEVERLQQLGRVQARAFRNVDTLSPSARAQADKSARELVGMVTDALVTASPATSAASKTFAGSRLARGLRRLLPGGMSDKAVENIARDLFDPAKTQQVIDVLRRAKVADEDIIDLLLTSTASASVAANAGD